jgi:uncharacterized protein (DUF736 family)
VAYELRDGQGTLFKNDRKQTDKHPDYTGSIKLPGGGEHWFSAWIKEGAKGKFMSVQVGDPKGEKPADRIAGSAKTPVNIDDDIPF